jgi:hypothetical protein
VTRQRRLSWPSDNHLSGDIAMANKDQSKGKAKTNAPKLTAKQKKEKKAKKAAAKGQQ